MTGPSDFGLSAVATLAHVADRPFAPMHRPFWARWRDDVASLRPRLVPADPADPSDSAATHRFESLGSARIGCAIELPPRAHPSAPA